jgi:hypothetical protein
VAFLQNGTLKKRFQKKKLCNMHYQKRRSNTVEYAGRKGNLVLFVKEGFGAVVDEAANSVVQVGNEKALVASIDWNSYGKKPKDIAVELANAAMTDLDIRVFASNDRMYTIPDAVVAEAKRGLEWRK